MMIVEQRRVPFNTIHNSLSPVHPSAHWLFPLIDTLPPEIFRYDVPWLKSCLENWHWIRLSFRNSYAVYFKCFFHWQSYTKGDKGMKTPKVMARVIFLLKGIFIFSNISLRWDFKDYTGDKSFIFILNFFERNPIFT